VPNDPFDADLEHEFNNTGEGALDTYTCSRCGAVSTHEELPQCETCGETHCTHCLCDMKIRDPRCTRCLFWSAAKLEPVRCCHAVAKTTHWKPPCEHFQENPPVKTE